MPDFPLRLCRRSGPARSADAWYLPSGAVGDWLAEIAAWSTAHAAVAIVPLAREGGDLTPTGALLIPEAGGVAATPRCVPFARVAPDFYVPADADMTPPLEATEIAALLAGDYVHVWQPGAGLTAADRADVLHAHDLVCAGPRGPRRWDRAVPGLAHPKRLLSLQPMIEIDLQSLFEQGRGDIATDPEILEKLPKSPRELKSDALRAGAQAALVMVGGTLYVIGGAFSALAKMLTSSGQGAGQAAKSKSADHSPGAKPPGKLSKYLRDKLKQISEAISAARHKELNRLLHMLDKDPDQGLRFAIPFSSGGHRGRAAPGSRLRERMLNFSLRGLGGGGPADVWDEAAQYQQQLATKYRELANREIRLSRHRRAAYIFAELLGDLESAAAALRDGKHYREAAIVYRDRLKRPIDAAKCFESGGLWAEALTEYEQLQMHEKIGDLYTQLEDPDRAAEAYEAAAAVLRGSADFLGAARIDEEKLADVDRAAIDLETGWLNSTQGFPCMRALFDLLGRHGRHDDAIERAGELAAEAANSQRDTAIADLLADFAGAYPDVAVREAAGEGAKRVVGGRLRSAPPSEAESFCRTLARLAPDDRLLGRDTRRYATRTRRATPREPLARGLSRALRIVNSWSFGLPGAWHSAAVGGNTLFVAGAVDKRIVLARSTFGGHAERFVIPWKKTPLRTSARVFLVPDRLRKDRLAVYAIGEPPLVWYDAFTPSDALPNRVTVGAWPGTGSAVGATRDMGEMLWVAEHRNGNIVAAHDETGMILATHRLPTELIDDPEELVYPVPMLARNGRLYIALGRTLLALPEESSWGKSDMPSRIYSLAATAPHTLNRIAVGLEDGAQMIWDGAGQHQVRPFADDMHQPVLGFNRGGNVVAASGRRFEVYDTKAGKVVLAAEGQLPHASVIAVFALPEPDKFGLVDESGTATVYEIAGS